MRHRRLVTRSSTTTSFGRSRHARCVASSTAAISCSSKSPENTRNPLSFQNFFRLRPMTDMVAPSVYSPGSEEYEPSGASGMQSSGRTGRQSSQLDTSPQAGLEWFETRAAALERQVDSRIAQVQALEQRLK